MPLGDTLAGGGAFTIDIGGQGKFGPDLEWSERIDYIVDGDRVPSFIARIRRFFPDVEGSRLAPNYAGIRPRVRGPAGAMSDWLVLGPKDHGIAGAYHLLGFDTPGLTACLAVADHVAAAITAETEGACRQAAF